MNEKINKLYSQMIAEFQREFGQTHGLFVTHKGKKLGNDSLMFVGRETNGMGSQLANISHSPTEFFEGNIEHGQPLEWLINKDGYHYSTSPFWRVVGKAASRISGEKYGDSIFETVSWANLYRIAFCKKGGRISEALKRRQRELCAKLLLEEIFCIRPKLVVFLTDDTWIDPFIGPDSFLDSSGYIKDYKELEKMFYCASFNFDMEGCVIPALVVPHPQNKQHSNEEDLILAIAEKFNSVYALKTPQ